MPTQIQQAIREAKAILFDFDGVILDTEWPIYLSWKRLFEREGSDLAPEIYVKCIGSDFDTWSPEKYLEDLSGKTFDWDTENAARQVEILRDLENSSPMLGAAELIKSLTGKNIAVVSSSSHSWVDDWLEKLGLMPSFKTVVCRGDAPKIKPAPDLYLEGAKRFDLAPSDCLVIEDSMNGMIAAHAAGMKVIAVPNQLTTVLDFSSADWQISSLNELI